MEENTLNTQSVEFEYGNKTVKIETGKVARQATSSIIVTIDNLVLLTTMVARKEADPRKDFFPLAVFYQEKFYAAGKIPGGYFKREARPTEQETLTSRLIDRPIRPLFPEDFKNEVQIFCTVLSADKNINPDIASLIGASAALSISGVPFQGPLGAARVGFIDSNFVLNPSPAELENSMLDMVVAGTEDAVLMVESEAQELSEEIMAMAEKARTRKLQASDMQGGCFTISSLGGIGGQGFTPIINTPEVGILGVSKLATKPVYKGDVLMPRKMLPLSLSYDHRAVNGGDAGRFLTYLVTLLDDVRQLVL